MYSRNQCYSRIEYNTSQYGHQPPWNILFLSDIEFGQSLKLEFILVHVSLWVVVRMRVVARTYPSREKANVP
jgi:hypothetical protein